MQETNTKQPAEHGSKQTSMRKVNFNNIGKTTEDNSKMNQQSVKKSSSTVLCKNEYNKLLLISNKYKNAAVLEKSTNASVLSILFKTNENSYDSLFRIICNATGCANSEQNQYKINSVAILATCTKGNLVLFDNKSSVGVISKESSFTTKNNPGKFFHTLFTKVVQVDKKSRLDFIAPGLQCDVIESRLQVFLNVNVQISKGFLGRDTIFYRPSATSANQLTVADVYFQPEKLKIWSQSSQQPPDLFEKIRTVGKGAFGTAVLYRKKDDNSLVVLKEINMCELNSAERLLALNEIRVLSMLIHPNIVSYFDTYEQNGMLMIEMEYADDGNLSQYLARQERQLEEKVVLGYFMQIVNGISYMHKQNVIHRDLKTANIFKTKQDCLKIGDFGVSKIMTTKFRKAHTMIGTPYYISPEICEGKPYDSKSDIWALGCILYELATRERTFQGTNLPAVVNKIMNGNVSRIRGDFSTEFKRIVKVLLSKNPDIRPTAKQLEEEILSGLLTKHGLYEINKMKTTSKLVGNLNTEVNENIRSVVYNYDVTNMTIRQVLGLPHKIKLRQVACGDGHVVAIGMERMVYSWGENNLGQLGLGHTNYQNEPCLVHTLKGKAIVTASCGSDFTVFVSENGIALSCGNNFYTGHGECESELSTPQLIEGLLEVDVVNVACGSKHVVALCDDGQVFSWGCGVDGKLGLGSEASYKTPQKVQMTQSVRDVRCSHNSTVFITEIGTLLACGSNKFNKLGLNERYGFLKVLNSNRLKKSEVDHKNAPTIVKSIKGVINVSMGVNHTVVLCQPDSIVVLGSNKEGQMGSGDFKQKTSPFAVKNLKNFDPLIVACGPYYTLLGTSMSTVLLWGTRPSNCKPPSQHSEPEFQEQKFLVNYITGSRLNRSSSATSDFSFRTNNSVISEESISKISTSDQLYLDSKETLCHLLPTPILNITNQQTIYNNNTDSAFDSSGAIDFENRCNQDHVVFLDGVIPYISGANVIVVVETNFPPPKKQVRTTNNEINDNQNKVLKNMDTDNSMLTSSGNASSLNMTPTWLKNELQEAVNVNNKQKCSKSSDSVQLKSSTASKKSNKSRTSASKIKQNKAYEKNHKSMQQKPKDSLNSSGKKSEKSNKNTNKKKNNRFSSQYSVNNKSSSSNRIKQLKEEHNLKITKLKEEHEKSKQESDLKFKNEIDSLRNQINEVVEMIKEQNNSSRKKSTKSSICTVQ